MSKCHEGVQSGAQPDAHNTIDPSYAMWEFLTGGTELRLSNIPTLQQNFTAPMRRVVMPRSFSAAVPCGEMMSLTEMQAARDKVHPTLRKWTGVIEACHRWIDGERHENCSVLKDIAEEGVFGYVAPMNQFV